MEELKKGISRRNLLKGATLSAAGVAALGMFGAAGGRLVELEQQV